MMKSSGYNAQLDVIIPLKANMEPWKMGWMVVVTSCIEQHHIGGCHRSYTLSGLNPHFWLSTSPHLVFFIHNIVFGLGRIWWSSLSAISMRVHVLSSMNIIRVYIYIYEFFNPVVFVKGKLILGFCNLAAIWLETQAAQERARESARILYIHANCVLVFLHIISWNILRVCLCRPGIGWARGQNKI